MNEIKTHWLTNEQAENGVLENQYALIHAAHHMVN